MEYSIIGKITTSHGIRGEVKIYPVAGDFQAFEKYKDLNLYIGESKKIVKIDSIREHKNTLIVKFKGLENINDILQYRGKYIYIDRNSRPSLPANEFYIKDLIYFEVYDLNGEYIGKLKDIIKGPANDIYVVSSQDSKKDYLIPGVKEFIKEINIEEEKIFIDPISGMIE